MNHDAPFGVPYDGTLNARVVDPSGRIVFEERYAAGAIDHERPDNMAWTEFASLEPSPTLWRRWTLAVRVPEGDPRFAGVRSDLRLRRVRPDPGIGGLINYVMIIPAVGFALLSLLPGIL